MARVALITGASRGIGAASALTLAEHGYRVVVNHRASAPQAAEVVATIAAAGGEAVVLRSRGGGAPRAELRGFVTSSRGPASHFFPCFNDASVEGVLKI